MALQQLLTGIGYIRQEAPKVFGIRVKFILGRMIGAYGPYYPR